MNIKTVSVAALALGIGGANALALDEFSFPAQQGRESGGQSLRMGDGKSVAFSSPRAVPGENIRDFTVSPGGIIIMLEAPDKRGAVLDAPDLSEQRVTGYNPETKQRFTIFDTAEVRAKFPSKDPVSITVFGALTFSRDGSHCAGRFRMRCHRPQGVEDQYGYFVGTLTVPCLRYINTFSLDYTRNDGPPVEVYSDYRSKSTFAFVEISSAPASIRAELAKRSEHFFTFARSGGVSEEGERLPAEFGSSYVSDTKRVVVQANGTLGIALTEEHTERETRVWISPAVESIQMNFWEARYFPCTFAIIRPFGSFPGRPGILRAACRDPRAEFLDLAPSIERFFVGTLTNSHLRIVFLSEGKASFLDAWQGE